jgi:5S rRNA maturation endonuclease (ribonuclease M5)
MANTKGACPQYDCDSTTAFSYSPELHVGKCHKCEQAYPNKRGKYKDWATNMYPMPDNNDNSPETKVELTLVPPKIDGSLSYRGIRGISDQTMRKYRVETLTDTSGTDVEQYYTYPSGSTKVRKLQVKDFYSKGSTASELFGQNLFPAGCSKKITITEGELDAMSVYQMINNNDRYVNPVVSLPSSTPSSNIWEKAKPYLDTFDEIILSIDNDSNGDKVAEKINNIFPKKVKRVDHGEHKDANDFLQVGKSKEFANLWWNAGKYTPDNIMNSSSDFLKLFREQQEFSYVPTGIQALDDKILGLMQGHFTVFKAPTGIGKTELMRYLEWNFVERGVPFAAWHLEETKLRTLLGLVSYDLRDNLTRKDLIIEKGKTKAVEASIENIAGKGTFFQYFMKEEQSEDDLCDQIRLLAEGYGCKYVFFEPIQDVITMGSEESKESALATLSVRLSKLAADLNVGIVSIGHTNENGDFKYCKMIGQRASVIVNLSRDKHSEDELTRNTTDLFVEKNRPNTLEGPAGSLLFDFSTFTLKEL